MLRGVARLRFKFTLAMVAYDLIRLPNCSRRPHDEQNVVQNGIETGKTRHHEEPQRVGSSKSPRAVSTNFSGLLTLNGSCWGFFSQVIENESE
jgi:hypothetical protein